MARRTALVLPCAALAATCACTAPGEAVFYRPRAEGSGAAYDPLASSLAYTLDSLQVRQFGSDDYADHLEIVLEHLADPSSAIGDEGGFFRFVNTEIVPIDVTSLDDSKSILPNVALHAFGGGMLFRKDAEWLEARGVPEPFLVSASLAMVCEVLAEAFEKPFTDSTDEIADVYVFRPLGIWLFADDARARCIREALDPVDWPNLLMWSVEDEDFVNTGMSYAVRPRPWGPGRARPFVHLGMTTLFGLSHPVGGRDEIAWGFGTTTEAIDPVDLRGSAGIFWDREGSLLASLVFRGGEGYAVRANVYPGAVLDGPWGFFAGVTDDGDAAVGVHYRLPIGLAATP